MFKSLQRAFAYTLASHEEQAVSVWYDGEMVNRRCVMPCVSPERLVHPRQVQRMVGAVNSLCPDVTRHGAVVVSVSEEVNLLNVTVRLRRHCEARYVSVWQECSGRVDVVRTP